jgi:hypothetical protein
MDPPVRIIVTNEYGFSTEFEKEPVDLGYIPVIEHYIDVFLSIDADTIITNFKMDPILLYDSVYNRKTGLCSYYILKDPDAKEMVYSEVKLYPGAEFGVSIFSKKFYNIYSSSTGKVIDSRLFSQYYDTSLYEIISLLFFQDDVFLSTKTTHLSDKEVGFSVFLTLKQRPLSKSKRLITPGFVSNNNNKKKVHLS